MIWKQKEKELTQQEAINLARKHLAPFWFGTLPLITGVNTGRESVLFPLDPEFIKKSYLILVIDSTTFAGRTAFLYIREWHRRYHAHKLEILTVLLTPYSFLREPQVIQVLIDKEQISLPVVADIESSLTAAFGNQVPSAVLIDGGKRQFEFSGENWLEQVEWEIQKFLRIADPGLPLFPMFCPSQEIFRDCRQIELGYASQGGKIAAFAPNEFVKTEEMNRQGNFQSPRPQEFVGGELFLTGKWTQDAEQIVTSDPLATLEFKSPSSRFSFVARPLKRSPGVSFISVECNSAPAYDAIAAENMTMGYTGESIVEVPKPQLYHVLTHLPQNERNIKLRFPSAAQGPIALLGLRFGEIVTNPDSDTQVNNLF